MVTIVPQRWFQRSGRKKLSWIGKNISMHIPANEKKVWARIVIPLLISGLS
jgi:hypothetical protein